MTAGIHSAALPDCIARGWLQKTDGHGGFNLGDTINTPDKRLELQMFSFASDIQWCCLTIFGFRSSCNTLYLLCPRLCFCIVFNIDLFVNRDDSLTSKRIIMRAEQPNKCLYHVSK